jgi:hypothetical protein
MTELGQVLPRDLNEKVNRKKSFFQALRICP